MAKDQETILLLDGNALLHRAWHALPPLTTKSGLVVNAAYGFAMVVEKMLEEYSPTFMVVAWDLPGATFRHEKYEDYKGQREKKEQELYDQIPLIQDILDAFGIPSLSAKGYEADDVIGTLSAKAGKKGIKTQIVTGDLDSLQLVDDQTEVLFFKKGISQIKIYDVDAVKERYDLTPDQLVDYKALRGDPSDNIPGVPGIGDKTATELLKEFKTIGGIFEALKDEKVLPKYAKKLQGQEETAALALELVEIVQDIPLKFRFPQSKVEKPDFSKILPIYRELEFRTLLRKHAASIEAPPLEMNLPAALSKKSEEKNIEIIRENEEAALDALSGNKIGVLIAEQAEDLFGAKLSVVALSNEEKVLVFPNPSPSTLEGVFGRMQKADKIITHDAKALSHATDWEIDARFFDCMLASYILHPGSRAHDLGSIAAKQLEIDLPELPKAFTTDRELAVFGKTADVLVQLADSLIEELEENNQMAVLKDLEFPLVQILSDMEKEGVQVDASALKTFSKQLQKRIDELTKQIHSLSGVDFNINSPSQLANVLFETLKLPTKGIKKTKSGFSTAASELEKLSGSHEIIPLISEYRELAKLKSTYADSLPNLVDKDSRIHTTYNQTIAATGRLSSIAPNLQNIPIKTELGNEIRKAFISGKGKKLIAADYSQIELRLAAIIANDKPFIQAFKDGADIHTRTAAEVFDVKDEEVTKDQRRAAKAINFGILYGMGPRSLAKSTGMKFDEAKQFIEKYFSVHHAIKKYLDETKAKAHAEGYVETLFGRRRYLPEIESGVPMLVAMGERMAINMPVQGTAADIMKKAMVDVQGWLDHSGHDAKMILQVHDELVIEAKNEVVDAIAKGVKEMMESVASYEVPLVVDVEIGENWGELKKW